MIKKMFFFFFILTITSYSQNQMPDVSLKDLNGKTVNVNKDFSEADKIYVFSFWATWCAPCIQELQAINEVYDDWKEEFDIEVVAISIDDSRTLKRVNPLVNGKGWNYRILLDKNQDLKRALSFSNPPFLMVVKNGKVEFVHNGYTEGSIEELYNELKSL